MGSTAADASTVSNNHKKRLIDRLARVEGQLRGIQRMIADESDCEAIAQQLAAARGGLNKTLAELIACAFEHRLGGHLAAEPRTREEISNLVQLLGRYGEPACLTGLVAKRRRCLQMQGSRQRSPQAYSKYAEDGRPSTTQLLRADTALQ